MANLHSSRTRRWVSAQPLGWVAASALIVLLAGLAGCSLFGDPKPPAPPPTAPSKPVASYDDSIGSYGEVPVDQTILVRGYGLVVIPKPTGSRECPPGIRKVILNQLMRMRVGETMSVLQGLKIDQWIDSMNTAAVEVRGMMPAGALANETFDVLVTALPGSQTTSLEGGVLIITDLSVWRRGTSGGLIHGKPMAVASGPVFINPFAEHPKAAEPDMDNPFRTTSRPDDGGVGAPVGTPVDFRRAWVLGGAMTLKDQPLQLIFREPDYAHANIAQEQLNTRFPCPAYLHGCAHATGPSLIELKVPPEYRSQVNWWLALVRQTYLRREPGFLERRTGQLVEEISQPDVKDADRLRAAITFAAIGKPCLAMLQPLYSSDRPAIAFHAAYAGLRIGDSLALRVMLEIMKNKEHPYRLQATQALGHPHKFGNIATHLAPLLDEDNVELRTEAYRSMSRLGSGLIESYQIGLEGLGFQLDIVRCQGPYLIYVTRSERPRIVLFGGDTMRVSAPLFLHSARTGVTISARAKEEKLTMMRADPATDRLMIVKMLEEPVLDDRGKPVVDPGTKQPMIRRTPTTDMACGLLVRDVVRNLGNAPLPDVDTGELRGLGLNYSQMVHVLYQLAQNNSIPSKIHLQQLRSASVDLANDQPLAGDETITEDPNLDGPRSSQPDDSPLKIEEPTGGAPKIGS
ncbi:MAG: flagellar basal body P-ring protein FlgI [Phycisphaerae bacterium]|nr:flagellar basal body P-ring protein FlgI [Phycisphaerae bacterium]